MMSTISSLAILARSVTAWVDSTLGVLVKDQDDIGRIQGSEAARILTEVQASMIQSRLSRQ